MVSLLDVQSSNARIPSSLPSGLVAVFVGATSGIGETTLIQFAKHTVSPRIYFIGRSQEAADRIVMECKQLNSKGEYNFIKADISLIRAVDEVCEDIKSKEKAINVLVLSQGTLSSGTETSENLHLAASLIHYSRIRFILKLLPLLQQATSLHRVVSIFTGGKEGKVNTADIQLRKATNLLALRGHASSLVTLSLQTIAKQAPDVSFIHDFPGPVKSNIARGKGAKMFIMRLSGAILGPFFNIPTLESGERHLFLATSAMYPAKTEGTTDPGVPLSGGVVIARGIDGKTGSGVYSLDQYGESAPSNVEQLLVELNKDGTAEKIWADLEKEYQRITS